MKIEVGKKYLDHTGREWEVVGGVCGRFVGCRDCGSGLTEIHSFSTDGLGPIYQLVSEVPPPRNHTAGTHEVQGGG